MVSYNVLLSKYGSITTGIWVKPKAFAKWKWWKSLWTLKLYGNEKFGKILISSGGKLLSVAIAWRIEFAEFALFGSMLWMSALRYGGWIFEISMISFWNSELE